MSDAQVKSIIERILRLHAEEDELKADRREVYGEAKANGYDKTALGAAVALIRKRDRLGEDAIAERETIVGLYLDAYDNAPRAHTHAPARGERNEPTRETASVGDYGQADAASVPPRPNDGDASLRGLSRSSDCPAEPAPEVRFVMKPYNLRPHCKRPERCGSYGAKHCFDCVPDAATASAA